MYPLNRDIFMLLSTIKRIENRAFEVGGVVSLAQGIPAFSSHQIIRKKIIESIETDKVDHYSLSAGLLELRVKVCEKFFLDPSKEEVIITAGAMEAISSIFLSFLDIGDEVVTFSPFYSTYAQSISVSGAKLVCEELSLENNWRPDLKSFESKINSKTKIILLCNPHNPTGIIFNKNELQFIGEIALRHNLIIVSDEVYRNFYYENDSIYSLRENLSFKNNLITVISFSKDFALSGWRIGFLFGSKDLLKPIYAVHDALVNCAPVVSQYAALAALEFEKEILKDVIPSYITHRNIMGNFLTTLNEHLDFVWPEGSYYFFVKIKGLDDSEKFCFDMIEKEKVALVPGNAFGNDFDGYVRLCFGRSEEDIREGLQRFKKYLLDWISLNK